MEMDIYPELSDLEIFEKFKKGSDAAFAEIYRRHWQRLYVHAFNMLDDEDEAKDIVQEIFTSFWVKGRGLELKTSLRIYFHSAVKNRILNMIEHNRIRNNYLNSLSQFLFYQNDVELTLEEDERIGLIEKEIHLLPPKMRTIFELRRTEEFSYKEIGAQLGISDKTVKKQINNAIKILKIKIMESDVQLMISLSLLCAS
jgi:RNA polymerase sigma-70 factor (ECF subfamily)